MKINPVTQVSTAVRGLMLNLPVGHAVVNTLLWTAGILVVCVPITVWAYRRAT